MTRVASLGPAPAATPAPADGGSPAERRALPTAAAQQILVPQHVSGLTEVSSPLNGRRPAAATEANGTSQPNPGLTDVPSSLNGRRPATEANGQPQGKPEASSPPNGRPATTTNGRPQANPGLTEASSPPNGRPATPAEANGISQSRAAAKPKPTLADVAALAGVSPATVSRALNGTARVSGRVRAEVEDAVRRLSYVRQRARAADHERGVSVAAVVCEDSVRVFADSFFSRILLGACQGLPPGEVQLALLVVRGEADYPAVERHLARGRADGILLISTHGRDPLAAASQALGLPAVLAGRPLFASELPYVDADNRGGAEAAVRHLLSSGRRAIASIAGPPDMAAGVDRLAGFRDAMSAAGSGGAVVYGDFSQASGEHAMARLLERRPDLDAVFVASDLMALGALRTLRRAGRRVPDDVAVIGFDDAPTAQHTDPRLTTVRQPVEEMGAAMMRHLLHEIGRGPVRPRVRTPVPVAAPYQHHVVLGTELVIRDSA